MAKIEELKGLVLSNVTASEYEIIFYANNNRAFRMFHAQDCCEIVVVDDIVGDINDLIGSPIIMAEEASTDGLESKETWEESFTWTFYKLATIKGYVTIKWYGSSNGYYSESVDFIEVGVDNEW